jgi:hypothetical protein
VTTIVIELSPEDEKALKVRTGKRGAAAVREWIARASTERTSAQLKAALTRSRKEEAMGKGRRFKSGREAVRWLES